MFSEIIERFDGMTSKETQKYKLMGYICETVA